MLNHRRMGRLGTHGEDCYTCVAKCDTAAESGEPAAPLGPAELGIHNAQWESGSFPVVDPYGSGVHLDELVRRRSEEEGSSASEIIGETNSNLEQLAKFAKTKAQLEEVVKKMGQLPEQAMALFDVQQDPSQRVNPLTSTPEVNAMAMPVSAQQLPLRLHQA